MQCIRNALYGFVLCFSSLHTFGHSSEIYKGLILIQKLLKALSVKASTEWKITEAEFWHFFRMCLFGQNGHVAAFFNTTSVWKDGNSWNVAIKLIDLADVESWCPDKNKLQERAMETDVAKNHNILKNVTTEETKNSGRWKHQICVEW